MRIQLDYQQVRYYMHILQVNRGKTDPVEKIPIHRLVMDVVGFIRTIMFLKPYGQMLHLREELGIVGVDMKLHNLLQMNHPMLEWTLRILFGNGIIV